MPKTPVKEERKQAAATPNKSSETDDLLAMHRRSCEDLGL